jgi:Fructosamine kinase
MMPMCTVLFVETDLWIGNAGAITDSGTRVPAVFDPACWYGHHEFDLALASLFGGFAPPYSKQLTSTQLSCIHIANQCSCLRRCDACTPTCILQLLCHRQSAFLH